MAKRKPKGEYKGNMTAAELGKLSTGGQRTRELIQKGKELEQLQQAAEEERKAVERDAA